METKTYVYLDRNQLRLIVGHCAGPSPRSDAKGHVRKIVHNFDPNDLVLTDETDKEKILEAMFAAVPGAYGSKTH